MCAYTRARRHAPAGEVGDVAAGGVELRVPRRQLRLRPPARAHAHARTHAHTISPLEPPARKSARARARTHTHHQPTVSSASAQAHARTQTQRIDSSACARARAHTHRSAVRATRARCTRGRSVSKFQHLRGGGGRRNRGPHPVGGASRRSRGWRGLIRKNFCAQWSNATDSCQSGAKLSGLADQKERKTAASESPQMNLLVLETARTAKPFCRAARTIPFSTGSPMHSRHESERSNISVAA